MVPLMCVMASLSGDSPGFHFAMSVGKASRLGAKVFVPQIFVAAAILDLRPENLKELILAVGIAFLAGNPVAGPGLVIGGTLSTFCSPPSASPPWTGD
jgi:hypothetical protein